MDNDKMRERIVYSPDVLDKSSLTDVFGDKFIEKIVIEKLKRAFFQKDDSFYLKILYIWWYNF